MEQVGKEELADQPGAGTAAAAQSLQKSALFLQPVEELGAIFTGELQHRWSLFSCKAMCR